MSCGGDDAVSVLNIKAPRMKDGTLRKFKDKLFGNKWSPVYVALFEDSNLVWHDTPQSSPKGCLNLKSLAPYIAVGEFSKVIPGRPKLPTNAGYQHVLAIGTGAKGVVHWFLCSNVEDVHSWMNAIVKTLPPPPSQAPQNIENSSAASNIYPQQPPAYNTIVPNQGYAGYQSHPAATVPNTTVVVQNPGGYYRDSGGTDFATGMLLGGMMGHTLSSPWGWGCGWGYSGGFYGGHSVMDNDTTIINNYNINETDVNNTTFENNDYGGTADTYGYDTGDFGGYDGGFDGGGFGDF